MTSGRLLAIGPANFAMATVTEMESGIEINTGSYAEPNTQVSSRSKAHLLSAKASGSDRIRTGLRPLGPTDFL
jgi:hypothetical protein